MAAFTTIIDIKWKLCEHLIDKGVKSKKLIVKIKIDNYVYIFKLA
jgi:hypothetical protein